MSAPKPIRDIVGFLTSPRVYATAAREVLGVGIAVAAYPLGLIEEAVEFAPLLHVPRPVDNPRFHANPGACHIPVFLVHGYGHNHSGYWLLKSRLKRAGFRHVYTLNYNPLLHDVASAATRLRHRVEQVCAGLDHPYIHIVGHSMGGIVARYYVQRLGGHAHAIRVITIASPHQGTYAANLPAILLGRTARQLRYASRFIRSLNEDDTVPHHVHWTSIYSPQDELVVPGESARLCPSVFNAENVCLPGEGHMSLLLSNRVMRLILDRLSDTHALPELDHPAGTALREVAAGGA